MAGTADRTGTVPTRRMAVARGTLAGAVLPDAAAQAQAVHAGVLAAKQAPSVFPLSDAFQPTHVDVLMAERDADLDVTCTVQAFCRHDLSEAALLGAAAALVALAGAAGTAGASEGAARIEGLHVVQTVGGPQA